MNKFNKGDRVIVSSKGFAGRQNMVGKVGTIVSIGAENCCVEFDDWHAGHDGPFHDGRNTCRYGPLTELALYNDPVDVDGFMISFDDLF